MSAGVGVDSIIWEFINFWGALLSSKDWARTKDRGGRERSERCGWAWPLGGVSGESVLIGWYRHWDFTNCFLLGSYPIGGSCLKFPPLYSHTVWNVFGTRVAYAPGAGDIWVLNRTRPWLGNSGYSFQLVSVTISTFLTSLSCEDPYYGVFILHRITMIQGSTVLKSSAM